MREIKRQESLFKYVFIDIFSSYHVSKRILLLNDEVVLSLLFNANKHLDHAIPYVVFRKLPLDHLFYNEEHNITL